MSTSVEKNEFEDYYDCNICFEHTREPFTLPNCRCNTMIYKPCIYKTVKEWQRCPWCKEKTTIKDLNKLNKIFKKIQNESEIDFSDRENSRKYQKTKISSNTRIKRKHDKKTNDFLSIFSDLDDSIFKKKKTSNRLFENDIFQEYELEKKRLELKRDIDLKQVEYNYEKSLKKLHDDYFHKI
ncbi:788_t:CDS:2 [Scutellospora calospora]|uniref:788_t:CDS:1 n=1 Tax=Scutellospora calospora TaxID=85575 RepID=A0ACA9JWV7_9GLOM|nr:788_t:CDS:2 [Scutellospora calospora]